MSTGSIGLTATVEHDGTGGYQLLAQTIRYNLGIQIDHYARVISPIFATIVDALGGVDISVDCAIQDWRLKAPDLDPTVEDNWEISRCRLASITWMAI